MEYRINRRTGDKVSILGFGTSTIPEASEKEFIETLEYALENGVNYYDLATSAATAFPTFGKVFANVRDKVLYQIHFGADYTSGAYGWTTDADAIKRSVDWQLKSLKTDYIDYAFVHCIDEPSDWQHYIEGGTLEYIKTLKQQGIVRHIGFSSHTPAIAQTMLDTDIFDMMMFSINPAYDYGRGDEWGKGGSDERQELYRRCERDGVGITVMKAFSAGQLLDAATSPFGRALSQYQCIKYALDKPAVLSVLPGVRNKQDLEGILGYLTASDKEKDYSQIASFTPKDMEGKCVYCNHCQPCPVGIDIATVNKYYDLAIAGDVLAHDHYRTFSHNADDCIGCGHCNIRCPFHADQMARMKEISAYFNRQ